MRYHSNEHQVFVDDTLAEPTPSFITTCHPADECAICNIYTDHFDLPSFLSLLSSSSSSSDPYTQGIQQGLALESQETDTLISRYRSRLASSHLKMQHLESESTARQYAIQTLQTQATKNAMEIEVLKREVAMERDRSMALETACDELQMELMDERRRRGSRVPANMNVYADNGDWNWSWDDDWEKDDEDDTGDDDDDRRFNHAAVSYTAPATATSDIACPRTPSPASSPASPSSEDWGWVYDLPTGAPGYTTRTGDHNAGFNWQDYQDSYFDEGDHRNHRNDNDEEEHKYGLARTPSSTSSSPSTSTSTSAALARARARLRAHTYSALASADAGVAAAVDPSGWSSERDAPIHISAPVANNNYDVARFESTSKSTRTSLSSNTSMSSASLFPTNSTDTSLGTSSSSCSGRNLASQLTIAQLTALIAVASSSSSTSTSPSSSSSSPISPDSALLQIRSLIQQAERTHKKQRSDAQVWLLLNWRRPSPPPSSSFPSSSLPSPSPHKVQTRAVPDVEASHKAAKVHDVQPQQVPRAPYHPTLDLPAIPEIHVDASATGVGFFFPLRPPSSSSQFYPSSSNTSTPNNVNTSATANPSQWLAYRWSQGGHPSIPLGSSGKIVISWAELIAVEMGVHVLRGFGYGCGKSRSVGASVLCANEHGSSSSEDDADRADGYTAPKTRIIIRSDNIGVVRALSSFSSVDAPWTPTHGLNTIVHRILRTCALYNMDLDVRWVRSKENLADGPSRASWGGVWNSRLGPGTCISNGNKTYEVRMEMDMVDWDLLQTCQFTSGTRPGLGMAIERVPNHLSGFLKPVGIGAGAGANGASVGFEKRSA